MDLYRELAVQWLRIGVASLHLTGGRLVQLGFTGGFFLNCLDTCNTPARKNAVRCGLTGGDLLGFLIYRDLWIVAFVVSCVQLFPTLSGSLLREHSHGKMLDRRLSFFLLRPCDPSLRVLRTGCGLRTTN